MNEDIEKEPINEAFLILFGFLKHNLGHFIPPGLENWTYRLAFRPYIRKCTGEKIPGTEAWEVYVPRVDKDVTIRTLKTLGDLRDFHKGMGGGELF